MPIIQLGYTSLLKVQEGGMLSAVRDILTKSRENNLRDHLTGFLLFDGVNCFQLLEGSRENVFQCLEKIQADKRHSLIKRLGDRDIKIRDFPTWSMGALVRDETHQGIFLSHGFDRRLSPEAITLRALRSLAIDLQAYERARG